MNVLNRLLERSIDSMGRAHLFDNLLSITMGRACLLDELSSKRDRCRAYGLARSLDKQILKKDSKGNFYFPLLYVISLKKIKKAGHWKYVKSARDTCR